MSATVAFIIIAICTLSVLAVFAAGWWMATETLSEEDDENGESPPDGRAA
jgi:hypothetical protein